MIPRWIAVLARETENLDIGVKAVEGLERVEYKVAGEDHTAVRFALEYIKQDVAKNSMAIGVKLIRSGVLSPAQINDMAKAFVDSQQANAVSVDEDANGGWSNRGRKVYRG